MAPPWSAKPPAMVSPDTLTLAPALTCKTRLAPWASRVRLAAPGPVMVASSVSAGNWPRVRVRVPGGEGDGVGARALVGESERLAQGRAAAGRRVGRTVVLGQRGDDDAVDGLEGANV